MPRSYPWMPKDLPQHQHSSSIVKISPWGGTGGSPWDDGGGYTGIRSIIIQYDDLERGVMSIQVEYDRHGQPVWGEEHFGGDYEVLPQTRKIELAFPDEFLTGVSGYHDGDGIRSVSFHTNWWWYGMYGRDSGEPFACSVDGGVGAIVGFSGRSSRWYLSSIGLYVAVLCSAGEFFDRMHEQGLVAFRTSPLCMPRPSTGD